jgi:hypothetical protein
MTRIFKTIKGGSAHSVCQDNFAECITDEGIAIGVVADGLGSAAHSDEASKLASFVAMTYLSAHLVESHPSIETVFAALKNAYSCAKESVEMLARISNYNLYDCDTTLATAVLIDDTLFFGQSGDSGIIALQADGHYAKITEEQNDDYGRVYPLSFGEDWWVFGKHPEPVVSALVTSDGFLGFVCNPLLEDYSEGLYIPALHHLMDYSAEKTDITNEDGDARLANYVDSLPNDMTNNDDVTLVVLVGNTNAIHLDSTYYQDPDWGELLSIWHRKHDHELYPDWQQDDATLLDEKTEQSEVELNSPPGDTAFRESPTLFGQRAES